MHIEEQVDQIVDDLLNDRLELTEFVNNYFLQKERVQELEEKLNYEKEINNQLREIHIETENENQRYKQALEEINYHYPTPIDEQLDFEKAYDEVK